MSNRSKFNFELDQIRKMWGLRKGVTLIIFDLTIIPIGYIGEGQSKFVNDNEAKP